MESANTLITSEPLEDVIRRIARNYETLPKPQHNVLR